MKKNRPNISLIASVIVRRISLTDPFFYLSFIFAMAAQALLYLKTGPHPSTDFMVVYEPAAYDLLAWLNCGAAPAPASGYLFFHYLYVIYIAAVYAVFGAGNHAALAVIQIILFSVSVTAVYAVFKKYIDHKYVPAFFILLYIVFYDNIQWASYLVVDHLYKAAFVTGYFLIMRFYSEHKRYAFVFWLTLTSLILVLLRIDTLFLFLPIYILALRTIIKSGKWPPKTIYLCCGVAVAVLFLTAATAGKIIITTATGMISTWFRNGDLIVGLGFRIPGVTYIETFDESRSGELIYLAARLFKLFILRVYHFVNIFPVFWSRGHKLYYALHMALIYPLAAMGMWRAFRERNIFFKTSTYVILMSVMMHGFTRVDGALRTMYTPMAFLIMSSAYGLDGILKNFQKNQRKRNV